MQTNTLNLNYSSPVLRVDNLNGAPWLVRLVFPGDRYGRHFCLTHGEPKNGRTSRFDSMPMVEFYDFNHPEFGRDFVGTPEEGEAAGAPLLGQFASSYYLETLNESSDRKHGIDLCGYAPTWKVDFVLVERVAKWANRLVELPKEARPAYLEELDTYLGSNIE